MLTQITADIGSALVRYAQYPQTGVTLKQMVQFGSSVLTAGRHPETSTLFRSSLFLADELPVRLAHRVVQLESLPFGLSQMPSIIKVRNMYIESFADLFAMPKISIHPFVQSSDLLEKYRPSELEVNSFGIQNSYCGVFDETDRKYLPLDMKNFNERNVLLADLRFVESINRIKNKHNTTVSLMAEGVLEWKQQHQSEIHPEIQNFLDAFYMSRIGRARMTVGIRCLIGQHVALTSRTSPLNHVGIINLKTNCRKVIQDAVDNARNAFITIQVRFSHCRFICDQHYGLFSAPKIHLTSQDIEFMYIPSHLNHMVFELVKNSMRAVIDRHGTDNDVSPPIRIVVAEGKEDITIKISDEGGGIPRSGLPLIFTYLYTTAKKPAGIDVESSDYKAPLAGYGYGLPLSRLYAKYFGGDLRLISMEGFGTDAYLHLCRLSEKKEPLA